MRTFNVPVKILGFNIENVSVCKQGLQAINDRRVEYFWVSSVRVHSGIITNLTTTVHPICYTLNMRYQYNPDESTPFEAPSAEWLAEHGYKPYPDDLPFPRKMSSGPHTREGSIRYLDADFPLPEDFPKAEGRQSEIPAWVDYLEKGIIYPGAKLDDASLASREELVARLEASDYSDINISRDLMEYDRLTGFNPLFGFQYAVLNMRKYSEVVIFELNGKTHALHWHNVDGYHIDNNPISEDRELALSLFYLFELVASNLGNEDVFYPVIRMKQSYLGAPKRFWDGHTK